MPIYLYQCDTCGVRFERLQRMRDEPLTQCPECDEGHVHRIIQPVGIIFKGSGFYITDNRQVSSPTLAPPKELDKPKDADASSKTEAKADKKTETAETKSSEKKE
jgi:putative FmdB family regulatory protein